MNIIIKYYVIFYKKICNIIDWVKFTFIKPIKTDKLNGISICVRINEDKYVNTLLEQLKFISSSVGEIIIHFNGLKDEKYLVNKCSQIANCRLKKYETHNLNLTKYTNDFIDEMRYKWFFLFDSDILFEKECLISFIKEVNSSKNNVMFNFGGVNILRDINFNIGFSNYNSYMNTEPFVGIGDFVCYVPYYTKNKKVYRYNNCESGAISDTSLIDTDSYCIKNKGLLFLHFSFIRNIEKTVDNSVDFNLIRKNINTNVHKNLWLDNYVRNLHLDLMDNTTDETLHKLLNIYTKNLKVIKNF